MHIVILFKRLIMINMRIKILIYSTVSFLVALTMGLTSCNKDDDSFKSNDNENDNSNSGNVEESPAIGCLNGHEYVDLGLSVKWASCNIGASKPESIGGYFGWADPTGKITSSNINNYPSSNPPTDIKGTKYDIASVNWGCKWRMPTKAEFSELRTKCYYKYESINGIKGLRFVGKNCNSIFLPLGGYRDYTSSICQEDCGHYWSSTLDLSEKKLAYELKIGTYDNGNVYAKVDTHLRCNGFNIRAVTDYSEDTEDNGGNNGNYEYERPDIAYYDYTATIKSLTVIFKIYNNDKARVSSAKGYYGKSSASTLTNASVSGELIYVRLSGLTNGTTYSVKCSATGPGGTSTSDVAKVTTLY